VAVYACLLSRAVATVEAIAVQFNLPVVSLDGFADIHYSAWQDLTPEEAPARCPGLVEA